VDVAAEHAVPLRRSRAVRLKLRPATSSRSGVETLSRARHAPPAAVYTAPLPLVHLRRVT